MTSEQTIEDLLQQAYSCLQTGDTEQALTLGNRLLEYRHARGFEVIALAHEQQNKTADAIAVLKEGVAKVPGAWPLWELLGNLYSEQQLFVEAHDAYRKALACNNADLGSINYNTAILLKKEGKFEEALKACDLLTTPDFVLKGKVLKLSLLNVVGDYDQAMSYGNNLIAEMSQLEEASLNNNEQSIARAYAELGRTFWESKHDKQKAWSNAWRALEWDRAESGALWLVREIVSHKSPLSKWFKLNIYGSWHFSLESGKPAPQFVCIYEVVAESTQDALQYARDLEPTEVRESMKIQDFNDMGPYPENQQGVYWRSAYNFFY